MAEQERGCVGRVNATKERVFDFSCSFGKASRWLINLSSELENAGLQGNNRFSVVA